MSGPLHIELVEAVADAEGVDPRDLDVLHEHVPLDVVEQLSKHETASWTLSFELPDHDVTVTSEGVVLVDGTRRSADIESR